MSDLLLDTNVLIDCLRGHGPAVRFLLEQQRMGRVLCSVVTAFELHAGCRDGEEQAKVDRLLRSFILVAIESDDSFVALRWFREWHLSHGVGMLDCLIGAAARRLKVPFFTRDKDHFSLFPDINLSQPY